MNLNLDYTGFEKYLIDRYEREDVNGVGYIFKFDNGHGASVIKNDYSYGGTMDKWELAVLLFFDEEAPDKYWVEFNTPITDDGIGHLDDARIRDILGEIQKLPTIS